MRRGRRRRKRALWQPPTAEEAQDVHLRDGDDAGERRDAPAEGQPPAQRVARYPRGPPWDFPGPAAESRRGQTVPSSSRGEGARRRERARGPRCRRRRASRRGSGGAGRARPRRSPRRPPGIPRDDEPGGRVGQRGRGGGWGEGAAAGFPFPLFGRRAVIAFSFVVVVAVLRLPADDVAPESPRPGSLPRRGAPPLGSSRSVRSSGSSGSSVGSGGSGPSEGEDLAERGTPAAAAGSSSRGRAARRRRRRRGGGPLDGGPRLPQSRRSRVPLPGGEI